MNPTERVRLGGMALANGVLVHGPRAWACAVRAAGQSTAKPNARPNMPAKIDIRTAAKCPEIIRFRHQEGQRRAAGRVRAGSSLVSNTTCATPR